MKCFLIFILVLSTGESLNKFLKHYEPLNYQPTDINRVSRSTDEKIRLNFHAYDRDFKMILERVHEKDSVFLKDATMEYENKTEKIEWEHNIFKGVIEGDDNSYVSGSINHGIFEGVIETSIGEEFWIESSYPYNSTSSFHSFIYSANDVEMPKPADRSKRLISIFIILQTTCRGSNFFDRRYPYNERNDDQFEFPHMTEHSRQPEPPQRNTQNIRRPYRICEDELRGKGLHSQSLLKKPQHKRETVSMDENGIWRNRICTLKITIDHTLYEYVFNGAGRGDNSATRSELKTMMDNQVKRVNKIYEKIDFGGITGIHFKIAGFRFYTKANDIANPFVKETTLSQTFLDWHSSTNFSDYCLSYVFTYRDFAQDTLGLAFVCQTCTKENSSNGRVSHNTGMITFRSNGNEIPERQRHLTLAHELGHSLGSNHDHEPISSGKLESEVYPECDSDGKTGHYIMYPNANDGKRPNHNLLSVCSIRNITRNLKRLLAIDPKLKHTQQTNCFISESTPICGNSIVEDGEECDCGHNEQECIAQRDQCCWHGDHPRKCTLKSTAYECSPTQGSCCSENCKFKGASEICSPDKDCTAVTYCIPGNYTCPASKPVDNLLPCDDVTGTCLGGECKGSICAAEGLVECEPTESLCVRHCLFEGKCTSTADLPHFSHRNYSQKGRWGHPGLLKKANEVCRNSLGTCDDVGVCRNVVHQKALAEGKKDHGIRTFGEYLQDHWWLLILVIIIGIVILGLCIVLCYYKVPKLSLRSPREKKTVQIEVKASETSPVKTVGAPVEPKSSDAKANPPAPDAPKVTGTVAPSALTGQWIIPEGKEKKGGK